MLKSASDANFGASIGIKTRNAAPVRAGTHWDPDRLGYFAQPHQTHECAPCSKGSMAYQHVFWSQPSLASLAAPQPSDAATSAYLRKNEANSDREHLPSILIWIARKGTESSQGLGSGEKFAALGTWSACVCHTESPDC